MGIGVPDAWMDQSSQEGAVNMKKIAICIAMIMALAPVLVIAGSDDASAEPVNESFSGLMADIYIFNVDESNATMGYVALILGIVLIVPLFAFGLRQRIRIDNSNGQDSVWMEDVEESEEKPKSGLFRKKE